MEQILMKQKGSKEPQGDSIWGSDVSIVFAGHQYVVVRKYLEIASQDIEACTVNTNTIQMEKITLKEEYNTEEGSEKNNKGGN